MLQIIKHHAISTLLIILFLVMMAFFTTAFPLKPEHAFVSSIFVVLFAIPSYYGLFKTLGRTTALIIIISMSIFALVLENFAIVTGFPYGHFQYGSLIGARIGEVPWTVGFAWTPILFGAYALSNTLFPKAGYLAKSLITATLMTLFDLVLDPGSVALGFWHWQNPVGFYGVPWSNFAGWMLSSLIAVSILEGILMLLKIKKSISSWVFSSYLLMIFYWTVICFFKQLWGPFIIGCLFITTILIILKRQNNLYKIAN